MGVFILVILCNVLPHVAALPLLIFDSIFLAQLFMKGLITWIQFCESSFRDGMDEKLQVKLYSLLNDTIGTKKVH